MAKMSKEYLIDKENADRINNKLKLLSIDDYDLNNNYEFKPNLSLEENIIRKFILKKKGKDLKQDKEYYQAIEHQLSLLDNSYFVNDYYPYRHLTIKYELTKQYDKMTNIIKRFFKSGIYAHPRHIDWFLYKLIFLEQSNYITNNEIDSLATYYDAHGALNKQKEHDPIFIADRIFQRQNGDIKLDDQYHYEKQEEKYALKEKGGYLERYGLYEEAIEFYTEIVNSNSNGAIEGYKRLAYIYEMLGEYDKELEIIKLFYKKKYKIVGKYTKDEFAKRTRNLNRALGTSYSIDDFIQGDVKINNNTQKTASYSTKSNDELLFKYADLYEKGLLTREEFDKKKKELLFGNNPSKPDISNKINKNNLDNPIITIACSNFTKLVHRNIGDIITVQYYGNKIRLEIVDTEKSGHDELTTNLKFTVIKENFDIISNLNEGELITIKCKGKSEEVVLKRVNEM